ncbi:MAG: glyoxylate/hydroxypyruvate reductase A [Flavobacteriaceae bacterium]
MSVVIIRQDGKIDEWKFALASAAPQITFYSYLEDHPKDDIEIAMVWKHPTGIFKEYPSLKYVASFGAGVDFLLDDPEIPSHVKITRVVDPVLASDMSEFVIAALFSFMKNLTRYRTDQISKVWDPLPYKRIGDLTVGIMGMGALGSRLAADLCQIGFKVVGWSRSRKKLDAVECYTGEKQKSDFLSRSNVLVCLLPLTRETSGIIKTKLFKQLPQGAYVINVARGGHLVDQDLIDMIDHGHISGACLDVYHQEPLPEGHPFWNHPKVFMTPHVASVSDVRAVVPQLLDNYYRFKKGEPLLNEVSTLRGY